MRTLDYKPVARTCGVSISAVQAISESKKSDGAMRRSSRFLKRRDEALLLHVARISTTVTPRVKEKALSLAIGAF